jgi:serine/threonine-protein kinase
LESGDRIALTPGSLIAGKYRVVSKLGEGGMGVVYEAVHQRLRQRVAVKMLLPSLAQHAELVERFEREARAAATIESPNVAKVMDVDTTADGVPYMVIEFLEGHDLATELENKLQLPIEEAVGHVMTACAPIAQAHALGIVHRDLKPSNLFLAKKGNEHVLKVLDFGIAKVLSEQAAGNNAKITSSMFGLGTPHYMSPEQIRRSSNVDGRSDIWALGVILYELLTGTVPFPPEPTAAIAAISADPIVPPRELRKEIPIGLDRVIMCALEKDREKRYATARELAAALAPFAPEEELVAMPRYSLPDVVETAPTSERPKTPPLQARMTEPEVMAHQPSMVTMPPAVTPARTTGAVASTPPPAASHGGRTISLAAALVLVSVASLVTWRLTSRSTGATTNAAPIVTIVTPQPSAPPPPASTTSEPAPVASAAPAVEETAAPSASAATPAPEKTIRRTAPKPVTSAAASAVPGVSMNNPLML